MPKMTYDVTASRDGSLWRLDVAPIQGVAEARWLGEAESVARAFVADFEGLDPDEVDLKLFVEFPGDVEAQLEKAEKLRQKADDALDDEWAALRSAAQQLDDAGVTRRDLGEIVGLPVQRVRRLLKGSPRPRTAADDS